MDKRKKILLSILGILLLVLVTVGVTVALFTYTKLGTTENTITTGTMKFIYIENTGVGNGINITNAFPVADDAGKSYDTENYVFDFKVEATNTGNEAIPYEVTLRKKSDSSLNDNNVKIYLTDMLGNADTEIVAPTLYSDLVQTKIDVGSEVEKTLYNGNVNGGELTYEKNFRLRMWIKEDADYNEIAGKTFTAMVNVYSNVPLVEEPEQETYELFGKRFVINENPTLTNSSNNTSDPSGLYKSTATNDGKPTYYFRGAVEENYIDFAGFTWRVVRVNEDGTIRIVMQDGINDNTAYVFNSNYDNKDYMYYANSEAKTTLETWYQENIVDKGYSDKVATPNNHFCEQAKVVYDSNYATISGADMAMYSNYNPNFMCSNDANNHGTVNTSIGLLSYDEVLHAGGYYLRDNDSYYLYNNDTAWWTMGPAGVTSDAGAFAWEVSTSGYLNSTSVDITYALRPVINLKADVTVIGEGTADSHWTVQ